MSEASREEMVTRVSLQCSCLPTHDWPGQDLHTDHVNTLVNIIWCLHKDSAENEALKPKSGFRLTQDGLSPLDPLPNCTDISVMYPSVPLTQCVIRLCTMKM